MPSAVGQEFQILYSFSYNSGPFGGVIFDTAGNLYGTTSYGTTFSGTVYELSPQTGGGWTETTLHSFNDNSDDGYQPYAGLAMDSAGNLYGTTRVGGDHGEGTVFELTPGADGTWTETILHSFGSSSADGTYPYSTPALDSAGNLYGTTFEGGTGGNNGTVFKLARGPNGWEEKVIHTFAPNAAGDGGYNPYAGVILDASGNLYGTTTSCSCSYANRGTVFELKLNANGTYAEEVLHYFYSNGVDGYDPVASLVFDAKGNLYGTTNEGGSSGAGTVFELSPTSSGKWREKILHNFTNNGTDGVGPAASVTFDMSGNLYSTTVGGGPQEYGTVFELTPTGTGTWNETILYSFVDGGGNGDDPSSPITLDALGNLYSTALGGGANGGGNVFEITP